MKVQTPTPTEAAILGVVTVCATFSAYFHILHADALAGVYGAVIGWGGRAARG